MAAEVQLAQVPVAAHQELSSQGEGLTDGEKVTIRVYRTSSKEYLSLPAAPIVPSCPPQGQSSSSAQKAGQVYQQSAPPLQRTPHPTNLRSGPPQQSMNDRQRIDNSQQDQDDCCKCCQVVVAVNEINNGIKDRNPAEVYLGVRALDNSDAAAVAALDQLTRHGRSDRR